MTTENARLPINPNKRPFKRDQEESDYTVFTSTEEIIESAHLSSNTRNNSLRRLSVRLHEGLAVLTFLPRLLCLDHKTLAGPGVPRERS